MRRYPLAVLGAVVAICLVASVSQAYVPMVFSYQGKLCDNTGKPVPNGTYNLRFRLFDTEAGGTALWVEPMSGTIPVQVTGGLFSVMLGQSVPIPPSAFQGDTWLQVEVDGTATSPRMRLATVGYAVRALSAEGFALPFGQTCSSSTAALSITNSGTGGAAIFRLTDPNSIATALYATTPGTGYAADLDGKVRITGTAELGGFQLNVSPQAGYVLTSDASGRGTWQPPSSSGSTSWSLTGNAGTVPGTSFLGTTDSAPLEMKVSGNRALRLEPGTSTAYGFTPNLIGGFSGNAVMAPAVGATIGGGGALGVLNLVTDNFGTVGGGEENRAGNNTGSTEDCEDATVSGGWGNIAGATGAAVGGGWTNTASGLQAVVAGGTENIASGGGSAIAGGQANKAAGDLSAVGGGYDNQASTQYSVISGGSMNRAIGKASVVPGGEANSAGADYTLAAGRRAKALHPGSFVWADSTDADFASTAANQFLIRASGNVGINRADPSFMLDVNGSVRGVGAFDQTSDRRYKKQIEPISDALAIVEALRGVTFTWRQDEFPEMNFKPGRQIGFIGQEVEKVLPEVVSVDKQGVRSVAYGSVVPVLVEAIKQQQRMIEELRAEVLMLKHQAGK